jgi:hypothetical protein
MPPKHVDRLFEGVLTEDLHRILATFCSDDSSLLRKLIETEGVNEWVRDAARRAYAILAAVGAVSVGEVTDYYRDLFRGRLARVPSHVWSGLVDGCADLHAVDLRADIIRAYREGLADYGFCALRDIEREWARDPAESLESLKKDSGGLIEDIWKEIENWPWDVEYDGDGDSGIGSLDETELEEERVLYSGPKPYLRVVPKTGRNDPCPCGSGKKYKKCCGRDGGESLEKRQNAAESRLPN